MRTFELFSGAGGLALGLEQAGFDPVGLVERDPNACATLRLNRPAWNVIESDVRKIDYSTFGPVQLVSGGPPCQPFSMGGKANGHKDHRDMFPEAVRAVRELQPLAFMFENVRGLLRPQFSNYVQFICLQLTYPDFPISANVDWTTNFQRLTRHDTSASSKEGLRYNVHLHRANAADFGVPQHRHRVFFIGFRSDLDVGWCFPTPTHTAEQLTHDQVISGKYWKRHGIANPNLRKFTSSASSIHSSADLLPLDLPWQTVRDAFVGLVDPRSDHALANHQYQPGAKSYPGHTGSLFDQPSKALKAGDHGVPGGENMLRHMNGKVRYFTVRESARIQTFPDNFVFAGSWTESMRQLGNAVPVKLAFTVANSIAHKIRAHARRSSVQSA